MYLVELLQKGFVSERNPNPGWQVIAGEIFSVQGCDDLGNLKIEYQIAPEPSSTFSPATKSELTKPLPIPTGYGGALVENLIADGLYPRSLERKTFNSMRSIFAINLYDILDAILKVKKYNHEKLAATLRSALVYYELPADRKSALKQHTERDQVFFQWIGTDQGQEFLSQYEQWIHWLESEDGQAAVYERELELSVARQIAVDEHELELSTADLTPVYEDELESNVAKQDETHDETRVVVGEVADSDEVAQPTGKLSSLISTFSSVLSWGSKSPSLDPKQKGEAGEPNVSEEPTKK